jgi:hypothetical protein
MIQFTTPSKVYSIWDTVKIIAFALKIVGFSVSIDGKIEKGKIKFTFSDVFILLTGNIFFCFVIYINFANDLSLISTKSFLIDKGSQLVSMFMITNVLLSTIINTFRRRKIWGIFLKMHEFDVEVRNK